MEDSQIIELFFERSEQAIIELSQKYKSVCLGLANNVLNNDRDAEECVNDAFLAVWNTVPPQTPDPLLAYLCRIVRNLALAKYHANTAQKRNSRYDVALDELTDCFAADGSVEEDVEAGELAKAISAFLRTLNTENADLFVRRYWQADSVETLAKLFHTNEHNIHARLSALRKKLKKYLMKENLYP